MRRFPPVVRGLAVAVACCGIVAATVSADSGPVRAVAPVWGAAQEIRGLPDVDGAGPAGSVTSLSCASPGNCAAGGQYRYSGARYGAFVASERDGVWDLAKEVASDLNSGGRGASGIAYLDIIAGTHRQQVTADELIGFHAIYSEDPSAPPPDQIPGQMSLDDLNDEHHDDTPARQVAR